jgi:hypothetical protein
MTFHETIALVVTWFFATLLLVGSIEVLQPNQKERGFLQKLAVLITTVVFGLLYIAMWCLSTTGVQ